MTRLLSIALFAATLSAQERYVLDGDGHILIRQSLRHEAYDGNGALEAFYKPHHSHRKAWLTIGILIGSGVATGFLATRASHPPIGRAIMPAMPAPVTPVFGGVTFVGIGGPGVPVTVSKGGN